MTDNIPRDERELYGHSQSLEHRTRTPIVLEKSPKPTPKKDSEISTVAQQYHFPKNHTPISQKHQTQPQGTFHSKMLGIGIIIGSVTFIALQGYQVLPYEAKKNIAEYVSEKYEKIKDIKNYFLTSDTE